MINQRVLKRIEEAYIQSFPTWFKDEIFKWKAIKHFQKHWTIDANDFAAMLELALAKTENLLASGYYYAKGMLLQFAQEDSEGVREQFRILYDESRDLGERVNSFIAYAEDRKLNHNETNWKNTFQDLRAISVYLWLMYPDKYYIYKYSEVGNAASELDDSFVPKKTTAVDNLIGSFRFCDAIRDEIMKNTELIKLFRESLTEDCYEDSGCHTLAFDIVFYTSRKYLKEEWAPLDYDPGLSVDEWVGLIKNKEIFTDNSLAMLKRMKDFGGEATCVELAGKYGESANFYNSGASSLGKRIAASSNCERPKYMDNATYWPIIYLGKPAPKSKPGTYIWKLRDSLSEALDKMDLSHIPLYADYTNTETMGKSEETTENEALEMSFERYTAEDFLAEVFMEEEDYNKLVGLLKRKKNVILQGAPGVGKTFSAKRLAYSIMGMKDKNRISMIQFHQNYSYEDFIMGYKPAGSEFKLQKGIFYEFCDKARENPDQEYFFIIDEINRGNLSKIFGELLQLIEVDYRDEETLLAYTHEPFSVPGNVYLIGMMNTADRSLALIDYALRRRFSFFEMSPGFSSDGFKEYKDSIHDDYFNAFISQITSLNKDICNDPALGKGFQIGHSYFCLQDDEEYSEDWLQSVMEYDILPTLQEYWFDDTEKVVFWENNLRGVFNG